MSDALSLLRNFVKNKKEFHEEEDKIVFGDVYYPKHVKTTYLIYGSGKEGRPKDYYTLECLAFLIKHRELQHPMYVKTAGTRNISVVSRPDRRDLLLYLDGEVESTPSIDKNAPLEITMQRPQPYVKQAQLQQQQQQQSSSVASMVAPSSAASTSALVAGLMPSGSLKRPVTQSSAASQLQDSSEAMVLGHDDLESSSKIARIDSSSGDQQSSDQANSIIGRITRKFDESAAQSQRAITDNIMPLSESLTKEKIAALKAKKKAMQRNQVSAGMDLMDDDPVAQAAAGIAASSQAAAASARGLTAGADRLASSKLGEYTAYGLTPTTAEGDAVMKEIAKREVMVRNRFSVLQSSGKQFEKDILIYLNTVKAKEEGGTGVVIDPSTQNLFNTQAATQISTQSAGLTQQQQRQMGYNRFDQERYAAKDETGGFSIDTKLTYQPNGGALSLTPNPAATPQHDSSTSNKPVSSVPIVAVTAATTQKTGPIRNAAEPNVVAKLIPSPTSQIPVKRTHAKPIIIVPNTTTSLITLYNCLDILQDLKYVTSEEKRRMLQNQNSAPKDAEIIMHRREDGRSQQFKVIDNVNKLQDQDWSRVVAVFAQGKQWQFKDWPFGYGNPADIFTKVKGFHLKMSGIPLDPNVAKWSVTVIELDPHKRHLDRARLLAFWDELDKFMAKSKPYLCL